MSVCLSVTAIRSCRVIQQLVASSHLLLSELLFCAECCALLRFFGVNAHVVDFERRSDDKEPEATKKSRKKKIKNEPDANKGKRRRMEDYLQKSGGAAEVESVENAAGSISEGMNAAGSISEGISASVEGIESSGTTSPRSDSCIGDRLISWVESEYFGAARQLWVQWLREHNAPSSSSGEGVDAKKEMSLLASQLYLPPVYFQHDGHSRTIVGTSNYSIVLS